MKAPLILASFLFAVCSCASVKAPNPVFQGWYADPDIIVADGRYWVYPTSSNGADKATYFNVFSSRDLVEWEVAENVLDTSTVSWAHRAMWAPCVVENHGKFFMFFSANDKYPGQIGGIGVAVADTPAGPFSDLLGEPLVTDIVNRAQPIDQCVFRDDDGTWYMYYGGWGRCNMAKLSDDFKSLIPFEDGSLYREITPEHYTEGPYMFKRNGRYYFMWSEGGWTGPDYSVAYAVSDSPAGPFVRVGKILAQDPEVGTGAGHHSVLNIPGTDRWYIVYHRHPLGDKVGTHRYVCIDEMHFDVDGNILPVKITVEGVKREKLRK